MPALAQCVVYTLILIHVFSTTISTTNLASAATTPYQPTTATTTETCAAKHDCHPPPLHHPLHPPSLQPSASSMLPPPSPPPSPVLSPVSHEVAVVVRSQHGRPHRLRMDSMRSQWSTYLSPEQLVFTHELGTSASWAVTPILPRLHTMLAKRPSTHWVLFIEDDTDVSFENLYNLTSSFDHSAHVVLGRMLRDTTFTIIHQFSDDPTLTYPDFACGWLASMSLIKDVAAYISGLDVEPIFTIDPQFHLAKTFRNAVGVQFSNHSDLFCASVEGVKTHVSASGSNGGAVGAPAIAAAAGGGGSGGVGGGDSESGNDAKWSASSPCVTVAYARPPVPRFAEVPLAQIAFAVKTAGKFHKTRLPHVRLTWGRTVPLIEYISDTEDPAIPTIVSGVPNTEMV